MSDKQTVISADSLTPNLDTFEGLAVVAQHAYHLGLSKDCPVQQINCAGMTFPRTQKGVPHPSPSKGMSHAQKYDFGAVQGGLDGQVNADHIRALREVLPRMVIRWKDKAAREAKKQRPLAKVIKIPTAERVAQAKADGTHCFRYIRQPDDEPAIKYMYMHLCLDQDEPERGHNFKTLAETGIVWPEELDAETEAFLA